MIEQAYISIQGMFENDIACGTSSFRRKHFRIPHGISQFLWRRKKNFIRKDNEANSQRPGKRSPARFIGTGDGGFSPRKQAALNLTMWNRSFHSTVSNEH
jgi:hypothetical protein